MKNQVKLTTLSDGSLKVKVSNSLYNGEFEKIKNIYDLTDDLVSRSLFMSDALNFVVLCAVQGWISGFENDEKDNYELVLDRSKIGGNIDVFHVINGQSYYDDPELGDERLQENTEEDLVEDSTNID